MKKGNGIKPINPIAKFSVALIPDESKLLECRTRFTKDVVCRAIEDAVPPHELLYYIATCPESVRFTDVLVEGGKLTLFERPPSFKERQECAQAILPYYASKKPVEIAHQGQIEILHSIAQSPLDAVMLDEEGRVIEDGDFDEGDE